MLVHAVLVLVPSPHFLVNHLCKYDENMVTSAYDIRSNGAPLGHYHAYY